jgi:type VI secretion system protein ImpL
MGRLLTPRNILILALLLVASGIFWVLGPQIDMNGGKPLASRLMRLTIIAVTVLVVVLLLLALDAWARRRVRRMVTEAGQPGGAAAAPQAALLDETELCITEAAAWSAQQPPRPDRLGPGAYAMPWVLVMGQPASGRASLVAAALLEGAGAVREAGGVRFILAAEAVLIEASSSMPAPGTDHDAWTVLLQLLAKARPRRPLDAIVLTQQVGDMLPQSAARGVQPAAVARVRLQQAMRVLGAQPPVYLALTQCDRLVGFSAALDGLDETAALGASVPPGAEPAAAVQSGLANLAVVLGRRLPFRLAAERDVARRAQAGELPGQVARLANDCSRFVRDLLRAGTGDRVIDFRGVYLTAAGGDEGTPVDGWAEAFGQVFRLQPPRLVPAVSPPTLVPGLLRGLVLANAGTGGRNAQLERRTRRRNTAGYLACLAALGLVVLAYDASFVASEEQFDELDARATLLKQYEQSEGSNPLAFERVLPMLNVAAEAATPPDQTLVNWLLPVPLMPPGNARVAADEAYDRALIGRLLPALRALMVQQMQATQDLIRLRELLRLYLETGSPAQWRPDAFANWAKTSLAGMVPNTPAARTAIQNHLTRLLTLMPVPSGLDSGFIDLTRERLRRSPHPEQIYARLKAIAASSPDSPPIDIVSSLGVAGAQLLMMRPQAGLPSVVPGFYTKAGFYNVFLRRLPTMVSSLADETFILGPSLDDTAGVEAQGVADLYIRDYVQQWRAVLDQIALQALPDMASLVGGLQVLSSPDSPLQQLVELVRTNTDLSLPTGPDAGGLLARITAPVAGQAAASAVSSAARSVTSDALQTALPAGLKTWPGNSIRLAFMPIIGLGGGSSQQGTPMRLQGTLVQAYGMVSGIAGAPNPQAAALQMAAAAIGGQGGDALSALRTQAASLPRPLDAVNRDLYNAIWAVLLQMSLDQITATWNADVAPICAQTIARRYPFTDGEGSSDRDVLPKDFGAFFGPAGVLDKWVTTNLAPFVQRGPNGQLAPVSRGSLRLDLSREGLVQISRGRDLRDLFFDSAGNLAVQMAVVPRYLDPRAFSATLQVNDARATYRHEPPRSMDVRWSGGEEAGSASIQMSLTNGTAPQLTASGPWALFRLLDAAERMEGPDGLVVAYTLNDARVAYLVKAASLNNPIVNKSWRAFRCVPRL